MSLETTDLFFFEDTKNITKQLEIVFKYCENLISLGGIFPYQSVSLQKLSIPHKYFGQADPQIYMLYPKKGKMRESITS